MPARRFLRRTGIGRRTFLVVRSERDSACLHVSGLRLARAVTTQFLRFIGFVM
jgi:hypothetical protein